MKNGLWDKEILLMFVIWSEIWSRKFSIKAAITRKTNTGLLSTIQFKWNPFFVSLKPMMLDHIDDAPLEGIKPVPVGGSCFCPLLNNCIVCIG